VSIEGLPHISYGGTTDLLQLLNGDIPPGVGMPPGGEPLEGSLTSRSSGGIAPALLLKKHRASGCPTPASDAKHHRLSLLIIAGEHRVSAIVGQGTNDFE